MSKITEADVSKIASLARVGLTSQETQKTSRDLGNILDHFSVIQKIDTKDVPTSDDVTGLNNVTREDTADADALCTAEALLKAAPETKDNQFKVKAIFE